MESVLAGLEFRPRESAGFMLGFWFGMNRKGQLVSIGYTKGLYSAAAEFTGQSFVVLIQKE